MTTVPPSPTDGRSSLSSNPVRPPIAQRYFIGSPDESIKDSLSRAYTSDYPSPVTSSAVSSNPPSPNLPPSAYQHLPPTPTGSVSFSEPDDQDDELLLPSYDSLYTREELDTPSEHTLDSPLFSHCLTPRIPAADDSSVKEEPSRHVDYLSHEWKEEDIWASWRHVITRREVYENSVRLENASWRTWAKLKRNLGTISPEALNWLKDCDVTWLYGPLIASRTRNRASNISPPPSCSESPGLCPDRKSILKKRTASEAILQRSLSQHTLLQHAGDILKAQEAEHSRSHLGFGMHPAEFEQMVSKTHLEGFKTPRARFTATTSPSGVGSPSERRHIHFNKEVLQCIAVEAKEEEEEEWLEFGGDESWDESVMVKSASPSGSSTPRASLGNENKTIAPLPSTTLKYRSDTPEPQLSSVASRWSWTRYLPRPGSSLIETLRQTRWQSSVAGLEGDSMASDHDWNVPQEVDQSSRSWFVDSTEDDEATQNFYLTSLGFLSHEDGPPSNADVIFDRMMDTVNTAKDIAHVIWNVGWRG
ncbi:protein phosphatase regulator REG1 [Aspergillus lucknowensis]|uniref:Nitrogen regulatory protein areA GATA-like domain-containing protein n=1 Tax=Aspergillus lucknowensis TaxID=176173 RepID=A0ABR4LY35_9EURO